MQENINHIISTSTITERKDKADKKLTALRNLLYCVATDIEYGGDLDENAAVALAEMAEDIKQSLSDLFPLNEKPQYLLNDIYEDLDAVERAKLVVYADELKKQQKA